MKKAWGHARMARGSAAACCLVLLLLLAALAARLLTSGGHKPQDAARMLDEGPAPDAIMLQGFAWDSSSQPGWYKQVQAKVQQMQDYGVTHVWLPPPSQAISNEGYMPQQLYNLSSKYGNQDDLHGLISTLRAAGIQALSDIVINHRCADQQDQQGIWNTYQDLVTHNGSKIDWGPWAVTGNDPVFHGTGNPDTGEDFQPAPDLDHTNEVVRRGLTDWLTWLYKDVGFQGWRFDFAKGYDGQYVKEYIEATTGDTALNVGEIWEGDRQRVVDWIDHTGHTSTAFDFPTKFILGDALRGTQLSRLKDNQGKAPGVVGWWPGMAVTFIDNHDTGSTQHLAPFPPDHVAQGYAYILTHPGIPCIFWDHAFTWGQDVQGAIRALVAVRRRAGIKAASQLDILCADDDLYVAKIDDKVWVKLGPRMDMGACAPPAGWQLACSGKDWAVWEKPAQGGRGAHPQSKAEEGGPQGASGRPAPQATSMA